MVFGLQVRCRELDIFKILEIFWKLFGIFLEFFMRILIWRIFLVELFGRIFLGRIFLGGFFVEGFFWEDFFGRIFWEEFFGRDYLVEINKELMFLSRFWGNFV
jgi:hypothetical protein